jgi:hypothetical protein
LVYRYRKDIHPVRLEGIDEGRPPAIGGGIPLLDDIIRVDEFV